jgi:hypothetical protein
MRETKKHCRSFGYRSLRVEILESRQMLDATPTGLAQPVFISATPLSAVQTLGMNALPATEVPSASPSQASMSSAIPWMPAQGGIATLSQAQGGILVTVPALAEGQLGSLIPMARSSHSAPEGQVSPQDEQDPHVPQGASRQEASLDAIARVTVPLRFRLTDRAVTELAVLAHVN